MSIPSVGDVIAALFGAARQAEPAEPVMCERTGPPAAALDVGQPEPEASL